MLKLLIAEDEHLIRKWLSQALDYQELNIEVIGFAKNGEEAHQLIKEHKPDIVLTDINMPKMTAFDLFEATQEISYKKIILSGYDEFENAKLAMRYGVKDFLVKPIDLVELRTCLVEVSYDIQSEKNEQDFLSLEHFDVLQDVRYSRDVVVSQVLAWISQNYATKFTTAELAKELNYSESYIYSKIKRHLEMPLSDYLNRYRIKMAVNLFMESPDYLIYEVANMVGFSDYKYFNKVFKKYIGMTVSEFKEKIL